MKVYTPKTSISIPILWTDKPELGCKVYHNFDSHTVYGNEAASKRQASHWNTNRKLIGEALGTDYHYPYAVTIKVLEPLTVRSHKDLWARLVKEMVKLGLSAGGVREITRKNLIDYHLLVRHAPEALMRNKGRKLRELLNKTTTVKLNIQVKPMPTARDNRRWANYVVKNKIADTRPLDTDDIDVITNARRSKDIYAKKRTFFMRPTDKKAEGSLQRFVDFGRFWVKSPTKLNEEYRRTKRKRKANRKANPDVQEAAKEWAETTGQDATGIEDQFYDDLRTATPQERIELERHLKEYAQRHHGEDYADVQRQKHEQWAKEDQRRQQRRIAPAKKTPTIKKPFSPDDLESFTP